MLWPNVRLVKWNYRTMVFPHLPCPAYPQYKNNIHTHTHTHGQWMFLWGSRYCITKINTKHNDTKQKERPKKISCRKLHLRHLLVAVSPFYSNLNAWLSSTHTFFILAATTSQYMWKKIRLPHEMWMHWLVRQSKAYLSWESSQRRWQTTFGSHEEKQCFLRLLWQLQNMKKFSRKKNWFASIIRRCLEKGTTESTQWSKRWINKGKKKNKYLNKWRC